MRLIARRLIVIGTVIASLMLAVATVRAARSVLGHRQVAVV